VIILNNKYLKNKKGQALVELALILPVLLLLIFGIIEFGRVFGTYLLITHGAREGARAAAVGATDAEIFSIVQNRTAPLTLDIAKLDIDITPSESSRYRGDGVEIVVSYPVKIYAPVISSIIGDPFNLSAQVIMRVE
jgi:Flp pilus assembly protein TadG